MAGAGRSFTDEYISPSNKKARLLLIIHHSIGLKVIGTETTTVHQTTTDMIYDDSGCLRTHPS